MALINPKQINKPFSAQFLITSISAVAATGSTNITANVISALNTAGTGNTPVNNAQSNGVNTLGIITVAPNNIVKLYLASNNRPLITNDGFIVYGRITFSSGIYTLSYFYLNASNVETTYTLPTNYTLSGVANYMFSLSQLPVEKIMNPLVNNLENPIRVGNVYGTNTNRIVTTNPSTGILETTALFNATSIPFSNINFIATNVADALIELYNNPISSPISSDLTLDDGYVVKAANGNAQLNLRYLGIDNHALLSSKGDLTEGYVYTTPTDVNMGIGSSVFQITSSQLIANQQNVYIGSRESITIENNTSGTQTTQNTNNMFPVAIAARNVTFNTGIVNSVALGGNNYTVDLNNAAFTPQLALVDGTYKGVLFTTVLSADRQYIMPNADVAMLGAVSLTQGNILKASTTTGVVEDSVIEESIGGELGIGTTAAANQRINIAAQNNPGTVVGINVSATGNLPTNNIALSLSASNAITNNYALRITAGDFYQEVGNMAIGATPSALRKVRISTSSSQFALDVNTSRAIGTSYAGYFTATGASDTNVGVYVVATGATNNYAGILIGQVGIGTNSPDPSALLDINSISQGVLFPRVTTIQRNAIAAPASGLMVYNTNDNNLQYYNGTSWLEVGGALPSLISQDIIQDTGYYIQTEELRVVDSVSGFAGKVNFTSSLANRSYTLPDIDGEVVVTSGGQNTYMAFWDSNLSIAATDMTYNTSDTEYGIGTPSVTGSKLRVVARNASLSEAIGIVAISTGGSNTTNIGLQVISDNAPTAIGVKVDAKDIGLWVRSGGILLSTSTSYSSPDAAIEIDSTTKALVLSRMTTAERNAISSPIAGMVIFNTTTNKLNFHDGTTWVEVTSV